MRCTLTGANQFMIDRELRKLTAKFIAEYGDLALERIDAGGVEYRDISERVQGVPFLAAKKLVVLRSVASNKQLMEHMAELLEAVPDETDLIVVEPKLDKRTAAFRALKAGTDFREYGEPGEAELVRWLVNSAKDLGANLSSSAASLLVHRVGPNQLLLAGELEKLALYSPDITKETIELLTEPAPQSSIFDLLDAAFAGNAKRALIIYEEQRTQKVEPQQILAMLAWQTHLIALMKTAGNRSVDEIAGEAGLSPFALRKSAQLAAKRSLGDIKKLIFALLAIDVAMKTGGGNPDELIRNLLINL